MTGFFGQLTSAGIGPKPIRGRHCTELTEKRIRFERIGRTTGFGGVLSPFFRNEANDSVFGRKCSQVFKLHLRHDLKKRTAQLSFLIDGLGLCPQQAGFLGALHLARERAETLNYNN